MNKKGDFSAMQALAVVLVVFLAFFVLSGKVAAFFKTTGDTKACALSIQKAALQSTATLGLANGAKLCNDLPDTEIKLSDVEKDNQISDSAVKLKLVKAMTACWDMVGNGELDPYQKFDTDPNYCMICSDVTFDKAFIDKAKSQGYVLKDMYYWMATTPLPGQKTSYFEYLTGVKPDNTVINQYKDKEEQRPFDPTKPYVVVWTISTDKYTKGQAAGIVILGIAAVPAISIFTGGVPLLLIGAGSALGGSVGFYHVLTSSGKTFDTGVHLVSKDQLGQDMSYSTPLGIQHSPFCTKVVNY